MKIKVTYSRGEYETTERIEIQVNEKRCFSIGSGEPEDMTISRDLSDALNVVDMMQAAYNAGKSGEPFDLEEVIEEN